VENHLYKITPSKSISDFATLPSALALTIDPAGGEIYVAGVGWAFLGTDSEKIFKVTGARNYIAIAGHEQGFADGAGDVAQFFGTGELIADGRGNIYVADGGNNRIRKISKK